MVNEYVWQPPCLTQGYGQQRPQPRENMGSLSFSNMQQQLNSLYCVNYSRSKRSDVTTMCNSLCFFGLIVNMIIVTSCVAHAEYITLQLTLHCVDRDVYNTNNPPNYCMWRSDPLSHDLWNGTDCWNNPSPGVLLINCTRSLFSEFKRHDYLDKAREENGHIKAEMNA